MPKDTQKRMIDSSYEFTVRTKVGFDIDRMKLFLIKYFFDRCRTAQLKKHLWYTEQLEVDDNQ